MIKYVCRILGWKATRKDDLNHWNVMWLDSTVSPQLLSSMKTYQRVNHFPGMYAIARKSNLCMNLNKLRKILPEDYNFYPSTWFLPAEYRDFENYYKMNGGVFIAKPSASSQGKGIFLIQDLANLNELGDYIIQKYIEKPLLIDGLKFDMRVYVLVTGCDPLRIFIHEEGLARFATEKYSRPSPWNLDEVCMHLTNYSLNKQNPKFIKNKSADDDQVGHKRSLSSTLKLLQGRGYDVKKMWKKVGDIVIKTLCSIQPSLAHTYRSCKPNDVSNAMCFEILGFDILLDSEMNPWLLEVNHSPSFEIGSPLDRKIKSIVIRDSLLLLNLSGQDKKQYEFENRTKIAQRSVFRKSFHDKMHDTNIEKEYVIAERDFFEENNSGGFKKIFPTPKNSYGYILLQSKAILEKFTGSKKQSIKKRPQTCGRNSITPQPGFSKNLYNDQIPSQSRGYDRDRLKIYRDLSLAKAYK